MKYLEILSEEEVELLLKVRKKILTDQVALKYFLDYGSYSSMEEKKGKKITARQFNNAAGNHAFDDNPEVFGITENQGHIIRSIFQRSSESVNLVQQLACFKIIDLTEEELASQNDKFLKELTSFQKTILK